MNESLAGGRGRMRLVLLVAATAAVMVFDGLQRDYLFDTPAVDSLQYAGSWLPYLFAGVSLPLAVWFCVALGLSGEEAVVFWFVLGTVAFTKDFAYIHVAGLPVFITDILLGALGWAHRHEWGALWSVLPRWVRTSLALFGALGCLDFLRGAWGGQSLLLSLRDFAMVLYTLFLPIGYLLARNRAAIRAVFLAVLLGALLNTADGMFLFLGHPGQRRYILYGLYAAVALVGLLAVKTQTRWSVPGAWIWLALLSVGCVLANARSLDIAIAAAIGFVLWVSRRSWHEALGAAAKIAGTAALLAAAVFVLAARTASFGELTSRAATELVAGTVAYQSDDDARFRLLAWAEAVSRFESSPALGEGFGVPFTFELADTDPRPHNSYLTVLYKMGALGLAAFLGLLAAIAAPAWRAFRRCRGTHDGTLLLLLLTAQFMMLLYAGLNLFLESPFFAAPFWLSAGMTLALSASPGRHRAATPQRNQATLCPAPARPEVER